MRQPEEKSTLPVLGAEEVVLSDENGDPIVDTVYRQIDSFAFMDQDSQLITASTVAGKVYVVDFFFTSCPTICPKMKKQMLRIYEAFEEEPQVVLLSHSIDTRNDTVPVLHAYAEKLEIQSTKWHLVTGERDAIYGIAESYMVSAMEDETAPGGYIHSGAFVLMDGNHHIRGYYDGTLPEDVDQLMIDMRTLLKESA